MIASKLIIPAALILPVLCACAMGEREQAYDAFAAAQDEARHQLRLFQDEPHRSCTSEHLAKASAGANANLALLDPSRERDPSRPLEPNAVASVQTNYGNRPISDVADLTLDVAKAAAEAGCTEQARVLYQYVLDRYGASDYAGYRQRAEVGLAEIGAK